MKTTTNINEVKDTAEKAKLRKLKEKAKALGTNRKVIMSTPELNDPIADFEEAQAKAQAQVEARAKTIVTPAKSHAKYKCAHTNLDSVLLRSDNPELFDTHHHALIKHRVDIIKRAPHYTNFVRAEEALIQGQLPAVIKDVEEQAQNQVKRIKDLEAQLDYQKGRLNEYNTVWNPMLQEMHVMRKAFSDLVDSRKYNDKYYKFTANMTITDNFYPSWDNAKVALPNPEPEMVRLYWEGEQEFTQANIEKEQERLKLIKTALFGYNRLLNEFNAQ